MSVWRSPVSEGDLLLTMTDDDTIDALSVDGTRLIYVDHSGEGVFADNPSPIITVPDGGVTVTVLAGAIVDAVYQTTDGSGFVLSVYNVSANETSFAWSWSRIGGV